MSRSPAGGATADEAEDDLENVHGQNDGVMSIGKLLKIYQEDGFEAVGNHFFHELFEIPVTQFIAIVFVLYYVISSLLSS